MAPRTATIIGLLIAGSFLAAGPVAAGPLQPKRPAPAPTIVPNTRLVMPARVLPPSELVPAGVVPMPDRPTARARVHVQYQVSNHGETSVTGVPFRLELRAGGRNWRLADGSGPGVPRHSTATNTVEVTMPTDIGPGAAELTLTVDPENRLPETDETNNARTVTLIVLAPDARAGLSTASAVAGGAITAWCNLTNLGTADLVRPKLRFKMTRENKADAPAVLSWNSTLTITLAPHANDSWRITRSRSPGAPWVEAGRYYFWMIADPDNEIVEANETDNTSNYKPVDFVP
ncbi:MAG: hypothetical protein HY825_15850 [Acidobacteria bacterium]|nr:hypothetical protein [Acidobacteriota bacterium]